MSVKTQGREKKSMKAVHRAAVTGLPTLEEVLTPSMIYQLQGLSCKLMKNSLEAQELLQDTLERCTKSYKNFRGDSEFKTWAYKIMENRSKQLFAMARTQKRGASTASLDTATGLIDDCKPLDEEIVSGYGQGVENMVAMHEFLDVCSELHDLMVQKGDQVTVNQLNALWDNLYGLSGDEIKNKYNLNTRATAKTRIVKGKDDLKRMSGISCADDILYAP